MNPHCRMFPAGTLSAAITSGPNEGRTIGECLLHGLFLTQETTMPPYTKETARKHNKAARSSPRAQEAFAKAATSANAAGHDEGSTMAIANAAANKSLAKTKREGKKR